MTTQPALSTRTNAFMWPTNRSLSLDRLITRNIISYTFKTPGTGLIQRSALRAMWTRCKNGYELLLLRIVFLVRSQSSAAALIAILIRNLRRNKAITRNLFRVSPHPSRPFIFPSLPSLFHCLPPPPSGPSIQIELRDFVERISSSQRGRTMCAATRHVA